jgi:transposase
MVWPKAIPVKRYPGDLTDEEWNILEPILKKTDPYTTGRPRQVDLREVINAFFTSTKRVVSGGICLKIFPLIPW